MARAIRGDGIAVPAPTGFYERMPVSRRRPVDSCARPREVDRPQIPPQRDDDDDGGSGRLRRLIELTSPLTLQQRSENRSRV